MMKLQKSKAKCEGGQALILFTLMLCTLLLCAMAVVDVGFFLHNRENAQQTADAAALAGAQDLPGSTGQAQTDALAYVTKNGLSTANTTISFTCTSQNPSVCTTGSGTYDTIVVTQKAPSPTYFGGVLGVLGISNCWVAGCTSSATAAGCRGACGGPLSVPLDVVLVMDRTGSMSSTDLTNAKNGATAILQLFKPNVQHVALGVLGQSSTTTTCTGSNAGGLGIATSSGGTWIPVPLSTDYQNSNGTLNTSSLIVRTINCLDTSSSGTDLGDPMQAAMQYLAANGRPNVHQAIIFETDGAANVAPGSTVNASTGQLFCTGQAAIITSSGDNNGYESGAANTCADDASSGSDANSGTGTSTSCTNTNKDRHKFTSFGVGPAIPSSPTPTVDGIEIRLDTWASSSSASQQNCVELSWDGGTSWTAPKTVILGTSQATKILGSSADTWGHTWTTSQLSNANFVVRVTDVASNTSTTFHLDAVAANVYYHYTDATFANNGPCDWANKQATAAKTAGIEVFTIGFGVEGDTCVSETSGAFTNALTTTLLASMATISTDDGGDGSGGLAPGCNTTAQQNSENADGDHFLCEAKGNSLTPIFQTAAQILATGSRLVQ